MTNVTAYAYGNLYKRGCLLPSMLTLDCEAVLKALKDRNVSEVTLQAPEGLKRKALELARFLEEAGYTLFISASPCYGACDLEEFGDLLLHVGHTEMYSPGIPVIYVDVYDDFDFLPTLEKHLGSIPTRVGILTTAQHRLALPGILSFLSEKGIHALTARGVRTQFEGQILGCDLTAAARIKGEVDAFLYFGTGTFHPLGAAIATRKDVFRVYDTFERVDPEKMIRQRYAILFKASQAETFGIVTSTKRGQTRKREALSVRDYLRERGKETYLFVTGDIRPEFLYGCDAYVLCACPRVALDDAALFSSPVLTPREVPLLFEEKEYEMDMIL